MDASAQLANLRKAILDEIETRAAKWEIDEATINERSADEIRDLMECMDDAVAAGWHIEGYDGAAQYLREWAPNALTQFQSISDSDLDVAFTKAEFWHDCLVAAICGARRGLNIALHRVPAAEESDAE
jgi:hypothetical protein